MHYFFLYQNFCVLCSISRVLFSKIWHIPEISTLFCGSRLKHQKIISMSPQKSSIFSQKFSWMQLIAGRCIYFIQGFGGSEGVGVKQSPLLTLPALLLTRLPPTVPFLTPTTTPTPCISCVIKYVLYHWTINLVKLLPNSSCCCKSKMEFYYG